MDDQDAILQRFEQFIKVIAEKQKIKLPEFDILRVYAFVSGIVTDNLVMQGILRSLVGATDISEFADLVAFDQSGVIERWLRDNNLNMDCILARIDNDDRAKLLKYSRYFVSRCIRPS